MRRRWQILIALGIAALILIVINAVVAGNETRSAELTAPEGQLLELSRDVQIVDRPATRPGAAGPPIVLLHGYAASLRWWDRLVPLLVEDHRVVSFDLVGHGGSAKPAGGYAIDEQAAVVAEGLNELGVEAATIVGHSMGGAVATALAERHSELVDRVVLLASRSRHDLGRLPFTARLTYLPGIGPALWRLRLDAMVRSAYGRGFAPDFDLEQAFDDPDQVVTDSRAMTYTSHQEAADQSSDFVRERTLPSRLTEAGAQALVILGSEDQIVDSLAVAADFEEVPGADVRVLEDVGHSPQLEAPEDTAELVLRFAAAAPPARPPGGRTR